MTAPMAYSPKLEKAVLDEYCEGFPLITDAQGAPTRAWYRGPPVLALTLLVLDRFSLSVGGFFTSLHPRFSFQISALLHREWRGNQDEGKRSVPEGHLRGVWKLHLGKTVLLQYPALLSHTQIIDYTPLAPSGLSGSACSGLLLSSLTCAP